MCHQSPPCGAELRERACWSGHSPFHLEGEKLMSVLTAGLICNTVRRWWENSNTNSPVWGLRCGMLLCTVEITVEPIKVTLIAILCIRDRIYIKHRYNNASFKHDFMMKHKKCGNPWRSGRNPTNLKEQKERMVVVPGEEVDRD